MHTALVKEMLRYGNYHLIKQKKRIIRCIPKIKLQEGYEVKNSSLCIYVRLSVQPYAYGCMCEHLFQSVCIKFSFVLECVFVYLCLCMLLCLSVCVISSMGVYFMSNF